MNKIIVIGGGPAGMFAAIAAAETGSQVILLEKNEKLGKKLFITGKGRCNITNAGDMDNLFANVMTNAKFLYSAFYSYDNQRVIDFFERNGLRTKTERGNRVFPVSDHSSDVIATLQKVLKEKKVKVMLHTQVQSLLMESSREDAPENIVTGVKLTDETTMPADAVIIATGGFSYQTTGSTGDGYRFAKEAGHPAVTGTVSRKRRLCPADAGTFIKKCGSTHFKWKKTAVSGVWRDAVYTLWCQRAAAFIGECSYQTVSYGRRTFDVYRFKAGTYGRTVRSPSVKRV